MPLFLFALWKATRLLLSLEAMFFLYYLRMHRHLQALTANPPQLAEGRPLREMRRIAQATSDIQAAGRMGGELGGGSRDWTPQLTPKSSAHDLQLLLHPQANESNAEQLLREWDALQRADRMDAHEPRNLQLPRAGNGNFLKRTLSAQDREAMERLVDDAEVLALKQAEISGWFLQRRTLQRWPISRLTEIGQENLNEFLAWAFFHCDPDEIPRERQEEYQQLVKESIEWSGLSFVEGYNTEVQVMRLTLDRIRSEHRPLVYYAVTGLVLPFVAGVFLQSWGFREHKSGTLPYWRRPARDVVPGGPGLPPLVFCHGIGVGVFQYLNFIGMLSERCSDRTIFLVSLPHISTRIKADVPSSGEMVASLTDMLASWRHPRAHFIGHSFGTVVLAWMVLRAPSLVSQVTFIDPVCFLLVKPDVCHNFIYRKPATPTQLFFNFFGARELFIAHSLSRNFFWFENLLWPEQLTMPALVVLSGKDSIVPAHSIRRYLAAYKHRHRMHRLRLSWFPDLGHGEMNLGPQGTAAMRTVFDDMLALEAASGDVLQGGSMR